MPSASVRIATAAKPGRVRSIRSPNRRSLRKCPTGPARPREAPGGGAAGRAGASTSVNPSNSSRSESSSRAIRRASSALWPRDTSSRKRSSRCWASSSTIPASSTGARRRAASLCRSSSRHSGMLHPRDAVDCLRERGPGFPLGGEDFLAVGGKPVVAAAALARLFDPAALDPASLLQPVEQRVERGDMKAEHALGAGLDQLAQLVAVPRLVLDQRQDQQLGAALLPFPLRHWQLHMWCYHICKSQFPSRQAGSGKRGSGQSRQARSEGRLKLDGWTAGRLDGWKAGRLEGWKAGRLEGWK